MGIWPILLLPNIWLSEPLPLPVRLPRPRHARPPPSLRSLPSPARPMPPPPALHHTRQPLRSGERVQELPLGIRPYAPTGGVWFLKNPNRRGAKSPSDALLALLQLGKTARPRLCN